MFVAAGAGVWMDSKKGNPLLDAVDSISITGEKDERELELERQRGPVVAQRWQDDPRLQKEKPPEQGEAVECMYCLQPIAVGLRGRLERHDNDGAPCPGAGRPPAVVSNPNSTYEALLGGAWGSSHGQAFDTTIAG